MIRAVVDANVFASGVLGYRRPESAPGEIFRLWRARAFVLITAEHLIKEAERTLADPFFVARVPPDESQEALEALKRDAELTGLNVTISGVASHHEDDLVVAAAVSATADCLVTGDKQLQRLDSFRVVVVGPRAFLALVQQEDDLAQTSGGSAPPDQ